MNDFSPLNIPPRDIGKVEPTKPGTASSPGAQPDADVFQQQLKQALGGLSENVSTVKNASPQNVEEIQKAMDAAKSAFSTSLEAHHLMQSLLGDTQANPADESSEEEKPE